MTYQVLAPILARFVSQVGDWLFFIVASQQTYSMSRSVLSVGILAITRILPRVLLGPLMAPVVRRCSAWLLLFSIDAIRGTLILFVVLFPSVRTILVTSFLLSCFDAAYSVTYRTTIPTLVPPAALLRVNAVRKGLGNLSMTIGPALAGLVISRLGRTIGLGLDALTFYACGLVMLYVHWARKSRQEVGISNDVKSIVGIAGQYRLALSNRVLLWFLGAVFLAGMAYGCFNYLIVYVNEVLHARESAFGLITSAMGIGGVIGVGLLVLPIAHLDAFTLYSLATLVDGACLAAMATFRWGIAGTAVLLFISGNNDLLAGTSSETILQNQAPDGYLAHVFAIESALGSISSVLGILVFGKLIDVAGTRWSFGIAAIFLGLASIVTYLLKKVSTMKGEPAASPSDIA